MNEIEAAFVMSGTGDITRANIQFPNKNIGNDFYLFNNYLNNSIMLISLLGESRTRTFRSFHSY